MFGIWLLLAIPSMEATDRSETLLYTRLHGVITHDHGSNFHHRGNPKPHCIPSCAI
jgi:hypothetical protein